MTEVDMRQFLVQQKVTCPTTASYEVVLELFTRYKTDGGGVLFLQDIKNVKYPLLPASSLHCSQLFHSDSKIHPLFDKGSKKGCSIHNIIRDMFVEAKDIVGFISLMSSLTHFKEQGTREKLSAKHVVPENVVQMGLGSRVAGGLNESIRILKRPIRHTLDPLTPRVDKATFNLGYFEGKHCLIVTEHKVKASMRNDEYSVECAFTENDLIATTCQCKAGCENTGKERVLCTHGLVPCVQLSQLLFDFLANDLLCNLRIRVVSDEDAFNGMELSNDERKNLKISLERLMFAATKEVVVLKDSETLVEWLSDFRVGTDTAKRASKEARPQDLGPLRDKVIRLETPEKGAQNNLKKEEATRTTRSMTTATTTTATQIVSLEKPDYLAIQIFIDALADIEAISKLTLVSKDQPSFIPIGFELLDHRVTNTVPVSQRRGAQYKRKMTRVANRLRIALDYANEDNSRGYGGPSQRPPEENVTDNRKRPPLPLPINPTPPPRRKKQKVRRHCCVPWCDEWLPDRPNLVPRINKPAADASDSRIIRGYPISVVGH
jgi:hypothetical protein